MARLPKLWNETDGDLDGNNWGSLLNEFLGVEHDAAGRHGTFDYLTLRAPNGTLYRLSVDNDGALLTTRYVP